MRFKKLGSNHTAPLKDPLPDPDDEPFLEVAIAEKVKCIITGNIADYPPSSREGINILSSSELIEFYRKEVGITEHSAAC